MSSVFIVSVAIFMAAVVLIEVRAIREGDERRHHAPGYAMVMGGLIAISFGIAAAINDEGAFALLASMAGLVAVALGATRHKETVAQ